MTRVSLSEIKSRMADCPDATVFTNLRNWTLPYGGVLSINGAHVVVAFNKEGMTEDEAVYQIMSRGIIDYGYTVFKADLNPDLGADVVVVVMDVGAAKNWWKDFPERPSTRIIPTKPKNT